MNCDSGMFVQSNKRIHLRFLSTFTFIFKDFYNRIKRQYVNMDPFVSCACHKFILIKILQNNLYDLVAQE